MSKYDISIEPFKNHTANGYNVTVYNELGDLVFKRTFIFYTKKEIKAIIKNLIEERAI